MGDDSAVPDTPIDDVAEDVAPDNPIAPAQHPETETIPPWGIELRETVQHHSEALASHTHHVAETAEDATTPDEHVTHTESDHRPTKPPWTHRTPWRRS